MATIMARVTRSGTLVGPGTKRKFRPGILGPGIKSSRSEIEAAERSRNKYLTQPVVQCHRYVMLGLRCRASAIDAQFFEQSLNEGVASPAVACARAGVTKSGPVSGSSRPFLVQATRSGAAVP